MRPFLFFICFHFFFLLRKNVEEGHTPQCHRPWERSSVIAITLSQRCIQRSSRPEVFCKNDVLRNFTKFTGKHLYQSLLFNKVAGMRHTKKTLAQVFSCEFYEISKDSFLHRTPLVAASVFRTLWDIYDGVFWRKYLILDTK